MAKNYFITFGSGDPRQYPGLSPTFVIWSLANGSTVAPPAISQVGSSSGIYTFSWGTTTAITFLADAATTSPGTSGRYVPGAIDPSDRIDEISTTLIAIGTSNIALGTSNVALGTTAVAIGTTISALMSTNASLVPLVALIGNTSSSFGSTSADPSDFYGYMKRFQELLEGKNTFDKAAGTLSLYSRGGSTLLRQLTVTNSVSTVIKT